MDESMSGASLYVESDVEESVGTSSLIFNTPAKMKDYRMLPSDEDEEIDESSNKEDVQNYQDVLDDSLLGVTPVSSLTKNSSTAPHYDEETPPNNPSSPTPLTEMEIERDIMQKNQQSSPVSTSPDSLDDSNPEPIIPQSLDGPTKRRRKFYLYAALFAILVMTVTIALAIVFSEPTNEMIAYGVGDRSAELPRPQNFVESAKSSQPTNAKPTTTKPTGGPSAAPSSEPTTLTPKPTITFTPTASPTPAPSSGPTSRPSAAPTLEPTSIPTRTLRPTGFTALSEAAASVTPWSVLTNSSTPQAKALRWLMKYASSFEYNDSTTKMIQRYAVTVLDFSLQSPIFRNITNDECNWKGVRCGNATHPKPYVTSIIWANQSLDGEIPDEIGLLKNLTHLDLGENSIGGTIPDALYNCTFLQSLYLHENRLGGPISNKISQLGGLVNFYARQNQLSGRFPTGLSSPGLGGIHARPLRIISLSDNNIGGSFPENMNLRHLWYLDVAFNRMNGSIPEDWSLGNNTFSQLHHLYLHHNRFSSTLPFSFSELGNGRMEQLLISDNNFSGTVPGYYRIRNYMQQLELQNNNFTSLTGDICGLIVFFGGEMVNMRADCEICTCPYFCGSGECY